MRVRDSLVDNVAFRALVAAAFGLVTAVVGYAWVRAVEAAVFPQADPRAVVAVTQSGYFVRCAVALFAGGMGAFGGWAIGEVPLRAGRMLGIGVAAAILVLAVQTWVLP